MNKRTIFTLKGQILVVLAVFLMGGFEVCKAPAAPKGYKPTKEEQDRIAENYKKFIDKGDKAKKTEKAIKKWAIKRRWKKLIEANKRLSQGSVKGSLQENQLIQIGEKVLEKAVSDQISGYFDIAKLLYGFVSGEVIKTQVGQPAQGPAPDVDALFETLKKQLGTLLTSQGLKDEDVNKVLVSAMRDFATSDETRTKLEQFVGNKLGLQPNEIRLLEQHSGKYIEVVKQEAGEVKHQLEELKNKYWDSASDQQKALYIGGGAVALVAVSVVIRKLIKTWSRIHRLDEHALRRVIHELENVYDDENLNLAAKQAEEKRILERYSTENQNKIKAAFAEIQRVKESAIHQAVE